MTEYELTRFGRVFQGLLRSRGHDGDSFAAECRSRGFKVGGWRRRDVAPESVGGWMSGGVPRPAELPLYADAILHLSEEEKEEFAPAYAYGQRVEHARRAGEAVSPGAQNPEENDLLSDTERYGSGRSVWLVTDGAYEDREVVAAFDNRGAAERHAERLYRGRTGAFKVSASVEELPLLSRPPSDH